MTHSSSNHPDAELLSSFALDALTPQEARAVAAHLAECGPCRDELRAWREVTSSLASLAPVVTPPEGIRERVLERALTGTVQDPKAPLSAVSPSRPVLTHKTIRNSSRWPSYAAAASLLLAAGLAASFGKVRAERDTLQTQLTAANVLSSDLAAGLAQRDSLLERVLGPDVQIATLAATGEAPSLRLFWNRDRGEMLVSAKRLPPAAAGQVYQLWGIGANASPVGLGTFNTSPDGSAVLVLAVEVAAQFDVSAVTVEPAPGSLGPTTVPILLGRWPADPIQSRN